MNSAELRYTSATVGFLAVVGTIIMSGVDPYILIAVAMTGVGLYALTAGIRGN